MSDSTATAKDKDEKRLPAGVLKNVDSTARDHLANERTWLAWLRTSVTFMALSLPIHEIMHDSEVVALHFAGTATLGMAVGVLGFATRRFYRNTALLQTGHFSVNRLGVFGLTAVALSMGGVLSVVLYAAAGKESLLLKKPKI
jgi:putative membrane protein